MYWLFTRFIYTMQVDYNLLLTLPLRCSKTVSVQRHCRFVHICESNELCSDTVTFETFVALAYIGCVIGLRVFKVDCSIIETSVLQWNNCHRIRLCFNVFEGLSLLDRNIVAIVFRL